jgi:hypothetical protein
MIDTIDKTRVICFTAGLISSLPSLFCMSATFMYRDRASFAFTYPPYLCLVSLGLLLLCVSFILIALCFKVAYKLPIMVEDSALSYGACGYGVAYLFTFHGGLTLAMASQLSRVLQALIVFSSKSLRRPKMTLQDFLRNVLAASFVPMALLIVRVAAFPSEISCGAVLAASSSGPALVVIALHRASLWLLAFLLFGVISRLRRLGALVEDAHVMVTGLTFILLVDLITDLGVRLRGMDVHAAAICLAISQGLTILFCLRLVFLPKLRRLGFSPKELLAHIRMENDMRDIEIESWHNNPPPLPFPQFVADWLWPLATINGPAAEDAQAQAPGASVAPPTRDGDTIEDIGTRAPSTAAGGVGARTGIRASYMRDAIDITGDDEEILLNTMMSIRRSGAQFRSDGGSTAPRVGPRMGRFGSAFESVQE